MSTFFRHVRAPTAGRGEYLDFPPPGRGIGQPLCALKARAVLVDMEEGVVNEMMDKVRADSEF